MEQQQQLNPTWPEGGTTTEQEPTQPDSVAALHQAAVAVEGNAKYSTAPSPQVTADDSQTQDSPSSRKRRAKLQNFPDSNPDNSNNPEHTAQPKKSVYESVLPQSIAFRPMAAAKAQEKNAADLQQNGRRDPLDPAPAPEGAVVMPLVAYLQEGVSKPFGWHRNEERFSRGLQPATNLTNQLEDWERQLAVVEILLLGGGTPYASFQNLAHGWGRKRGFHSSLVNGVCDRRGDIIRKRKNEFGDDVSSTKRNSITGSSSNPPDPPPAGGR